LIAFGASWPPRIKILLPSGGDRRRPLTLAVANVQVNEAELAVLMRAAQEGDSAAYGQLLCAVMPLVRRLAVRRWTGSDDAEDVVQDVLLSLHQVRHTYDPRRPFLPWLMAIARNRLADVQRRQVRRARGEVAVEVLPETISEEETKELIDRMADAEALTQALAQLPAGQRKAVELLRIKEMSLKEAAAASGMSIAALKVSMHRAMKSLRVILTRR
jgi:RNA polymerase sigma-70 factor (ECF subfamily)